MAVVTGLLNEFNAVGSDGTLVQRVGMAVLNAAAAIVSEGSGVTNHTNRSTLAKAVAQPGAVFSTNGYAAAFADLILALGTTDPTSDTSVQSAVNSVWNVVAGGL